MKLYRKDNAETVSVMAAPFDGAEEIEVMTYDDLRKALADYYERNGKIYNVDGMLNQLCQNGEGDGPSTGSDFDETRFDAAYCSDDEKELTAVFGGSSIYEYCRLAWDEDGEYEVAVPNEIWYRVN